MRGGWSNRVDMFVGCMVVVVGVVGNKGYVKERSKVAKTES